MTLAEIADALGIKLSVMMAGLSGGIVRGLSRRRYTTREIVASPICGALAAAYITAPVLHYYASTGLPMPEEPATAMNAAAFFVGVSAMWIADLVFDVATRWIRGGNVNA